jgi:hypothetical protein
VIATPASQFQFRPRVCSPHGFDFANKLVFSLSASGLVLSCPCPVPSSLSSNTSNELSRRVRSPFEKMPGFIDNLVVRSVVLVLCCLLLAMFCLGFVFRNNLSVCIFAPLFTYSHSMIFDPPNFHSSLHLTLSSNWKRRRDCIRCNWNSWHNSSEALSKEREFVEVPFTLGRLITKPLRWILSCCSSNVVLWFEPQFCEINAQATPKEALTLNLPIFILYSKPFRGTGRYPPPP